VIYISYLKADFTPINPPGLPTKCPAGSPSSPGIFRLGNMGRHTNENAQASHGTGGTSFRCGGFLK